MTISYVNSFVSAQGLRWAHPAHGGCRPHRRQLHLQRPHYRRRCHLWWRTGFDHGGGHDTVTVGRSKFLYVGNYYLHGTLLFTWNTGGWQRGHWGRSGLALSPLQEQRRNTGSCCTAWLRHPQHSGSSAAGWRLGAAKAWSHVPSLTPKAGSVTSKVRGKEGGREGETEGEGEREREGEERGW